jgi:hypothetical protein
LTAAPTQAILVVTVAVEVVANAGAAESAMRLSEIALLSRIFFIG